MGRNSDLNIEIETELAYCWNDEGMTNDQAIEHIRKKYIHYGSYAVDHAKAIIKREEEQWNC